MQRRPHPTRNRNRKMGDQQPTPSAKHRRTLEPWTTVVRGWLKDAGASDAECAAVLHALVEAKAVPPTRDRAIGELETLREQVTAYLEGGRAHSRQAEALALEQQQREEAEREAKAREEALQQRLEERRQEQRREAEQIAAAQREARERAAAEAAANAQGDDDDDDDARE